MLDGYIYDRMYLMPKSDGFTPIKSGFTLVELLVVVTIIAVLSVIGMVIFGGIQRNARDARRRLDIDAISKAWELHYSATSPRYSTLQGGWFVSGNIPADPVNTGSYTYTGTGTNADTYNVCATLEAGGTFCRINQQ